MTVLESRSISPMGAGVPNALNSPALQVAGSYDRLDMILSCTGLDAICCHLLRHVVPSLMGLGPRVLVLQGAGGVGKSSLLKATCSRARVHVYQSSGAQFSGGTEGAPIDEIERVKKEILTISATLGGTLVWVIDDVHLSPMMSRDTEDTINRQLMQGAWQDLCDTGKVADAAGRPVAIFVTGNSFNNAMDTLFRPSRASFFTLELSEAELMAMISHSLELTRFGEGAVERLVANHGLRSMAFWHQVKAQVLDDELLRLYRAHGFDLVAIDQGVMMARTRISLEDLDQAAARLGKAQGQDFLKNWR